MNKTLLNNFYLLLFPLKVIAFLDLKLQFNPTVNFPALLVICCASPFGITGKGQYSNSVIKQKIQNALFWILDIKPYHLYVFRDWSISMGGG